MSVIDGSLVITLGLLAACLGMVARRVLMLERTILGMREAAGVSTGQRGGDTPLESTSDVRRLARFNAPAPHPQPAPRVVSPATVRRSIERKFAEKAALRREAGGTA